MLVMPMLGNRGKKRYLGFLDSQPGPICTPSGSERKKELSFHNVVDNIFEDDT